jgi:DNA-binding CsgD family transcriptional regulator
MQSGEVTEADRLSLLQAGERVAKLGSWEWRPQSGQLIWSDNLYRLYGIEPGQVVPRPEVVFGLTHDDDRERVVGYVESLREVPDLPPLEYRIRLPALGVRYLRSTTTSFELGAGGAHRIIGAVQDVTDQRIAGRDIAAHVAVATAVSEWECFDHSAVRMLGEIGEACEYSLGVFWVPCGDALVARAMWNQPELNVAEFKSATFSLRLEEGAGVPGRAWHSMQPESFADVTIHQGYLRTEAARSLGLRGALAIPAVRTQEVLAVLEFYSRDEILAAPINQTLTAIAYELGEFFARRRGQLAPPALTPRELEVLQLAAQGRTTAEMAQSMSIGAATAKTHLENIYRKLGVPDRSAAVALALRLGIID